MSVNKVCSQGDLGRSDVGLVPLIIVPILKTSRKTKKKNLVQNLFALRVFYVHN